MNNLTQFNREVDGQTVMTVDETDPREIMPGKDVQRSNITISIILIDTKDRQHSMLLLHQM